MSIVSKNIENLKPNKEYIVTVRAKNNDINVLSGYTDSVRFRTPTDSTIPNAPSNLVLAASFLNVLFKYTDSVDEDAGRAGRTHEAHGDEGRRLRRTHRGGAVAQGL